MTDTPVPPQRTPPRPAYVTVPTGLRSYEETVEELTGYLEVMLNFDADSPVSGEGVISRQDVATAFHTRVRYIEFRILCGEIAAHGTKTPFPREWSKLRTGPIQSVLSALRHQMDLGSRKLSEAAFLQAERGDVGPRR